MGLRLRFPIANRNDESGDSGSTSTASLNVFCQSEEPEIKEGIWIQSDKGYSNVVVNTSIHNVEASLVDVQTEYPNLYNCSSSASFLGMKDSIAYLSYNASGSVIKYHLDTDTVESSVTLSNFKNYRGAKCILGDYLYTFAGSADYDYGSTNYTYYTYRYSLSDLTATPTTLARIPAYSSSCKAIPDVNNNCIYIYGSFSGGGDFSETDRKAKLYKYDVANDKFTLIVSDVDYTVHTNIYFDCANVGLEIVDNYLYTFFYGQGKKINLNTGEVILLSNFSDSGHTSFHTAIYIKEANIIYILIGDTPPLIYYDIATDTYKTVYESVYDYNATSNGVFYPFIINNRIFFNPQTVLEFELNPKTFSNGDFLIQRKDNLYGKYHTQLYGNSGEDFGLSIGRFETTFDDAWLYTNGDFDTTLPTYYGDGRQWVKFKN